ncbi:MAG: helix-turn-helix transcriptional regulator [Oscillospiraceae bacterium]|nr:helix-turn-helix transcriptional regulator [Oscillospiraceae bacterium]
MKNLILNEKELRKKMIDLDIKTINELATKAGVSKPTIYEYINGKSPLSAAFIRLCDYLSVNPRDILIETEITPTEE